MMLPHLSTRLVAVASLLISFSLVANSFGQADESHSAEPRFDSADFWTHLDGRPVESGWEFGEDEIRLVAPQGGANSIVSPPLSPNFELTFDWKIESKTNTGVKYRARRFDSRWLGIEYQIIDDRADSLSAGSTASIYDLVAPSIEKQLQPIGSWNNAKIVARGELLEHYLNGQLVASVRTAGPDWDRRIALSKFYGAEAFGVPQEGDRIMLTDHGGKATYRNLRFAALRIDNDPAADAVDKGPFLGNGLKNSWADQTSVVLWTRTTAAPEMNTTGNRFVSLSAKDANRMSEQRDPNKILKLQLPEGSELHEMFGACPGAAGKVRLIYFAGKNRKAATTTPWVTTSAESDFTAQWTLTGLKPDTPYAVIAEVAAVDDALNETTAVVRGGFRTAPKNTDSQDLRFCFTTCHDFIRRDDELNGHKIYPAMTEVDPHFVVHAGDIEYYDKPDPWAMTIDLMRFKWGRIFALPNNRRFYSNTTSYFLKDDHDTLKNDCWAGQRYGSVTFDEGVRLFNEEQFPTHSPRYKTVRWGRDLQVWFLEGRDYRSPNTMPDGPDKTILGTQQKAWLFSTLEESDAKFKLICSPTPVVGPDREKKKDNHANSVFAHEGDEIRAELAKHRGVIVLCGDRHWQYASYDDQADLWEFGCGPGSEKHQLGWKAGDQRPLHRFLRVKGGFLSGELRSRNDVEKSVLTIRHHKVTGEPVSEFRFTGTDTATLRNALE